MATDLRVSILLIIAALAAQGETVIDRVYHLDRGLERIDDKLGPCGASDYRLASTQPHCIQPEKGTTSH